jgi:hypothetical protein
MQALLQAMEARPAIAAARANGLVPYPVTASPSEAAIRERLPKLLEASA